MSGLRYNCIMKSTIFNRTYSNRTYRGNEAIRRIVTFVVAIIFVLGCTWLPGTEFVVQGHATEKDSGNYVDGQVIVSYVSTDDMNLTAGQEKKSDRMLGDAEEIITLKDVSLADVDVDESKLVKSVQKSEEVDKTLAVVNSDSKSTEELISEIEKLPNVDYVEPNYIFSICQENETELMAEDVEQPEIAEDTEDADTAELNQEATEGETPVTRDYTWNQWGFRNSSYGMNIPDWNKSEVKNSEGTVVAIMDTGVDYNHEDLKDVMWDEGLKYSALTKMGGGKYGINEYDGTEDPMDNNDHGTHCAGIVAAQWNGIGVSGAANGTKLMAVKAGNSKGGFSYAAILEGYKYVIEAKKQGVNVVAINNSWGGGAQSATGLQDLVSKAGSLGIVSVFASANSKADCDVIHKFDTSSGGYEGYYICYYLKDSPYVVTVDSIDDDGRMSNFSNYGAETTHLAAPGGDILSTVIGDYRYKDGTSMAAPAVSGEVAIVSKEFANAPADAIASIVRNNVKTNSNLNGKCKSGGQADVQAALNADPKELQYRNIRLTKTEYTYDGTEKKPEVIIKNLKKDRDYEVIYQDNPVNAGTYKVTVNALGTYYAGSVELTYKINKATPQLSLQDKEYIYDGAVKSNVANIAGSNGEEWSEGADYTVSGSLSAKKPGTYTITLTPADTQNYSVVTETYRIAVQPTEVYKLYRASKAFRVVAQKQAKKYVTGYQVRYSLYGSMSSTTTKTIGSKYTTVSKKVAKLKKKRMYYVQVRSYKTISKKKYYSDWSEIRTVTTK